MKLYRRLGRLAEYKTSILKTREEGKDNRVRFK